MMPCVGDRCSRWQKRRTLSLIFFIGFGSILVFTLIAPSRTSGGNQQPGPGRQQGPRKIRSLRELQKRAATEAVAKSTSMSSMEMSTNAMADIISTLSPIPSSGEMNTELPTTSSPSSPSPSSPAPKTAEAKLPKKVSRRDKYKPFELPVNYSKNVIPSAQAAYIHLIETSAELEKYEAGITPVRVFIGTRLEGIQVNELEEELIMSLQLILRWDDAFIQSSYSQQTKYSDASSTQHYRTVDPSFVDKIWKPDIFIENLVTVTQPKLINSLITLNINPYTGTVVYISRLTIKISCNMDFQYYPVDTQECEVKLRSNSYTIGEIQLHWDDVVLLDPSEPNFYVQLSDFDSAPHVEDFLGYVHKQISTVKFTVLAKRKISYHMIQSYLPSVFFVFITWMCFLIPPKSVEVRIGIAMTTLLTLTAMFASIRESTPIVSYVKAIDIWMVFCIFFVFGTLLEFAIITYLQGYVEQLKEKHEEHDQKRRASAPSNKNNGHDSDGQQRPSISSLDGVHVEDAKLVLSRKARYFSFLADFIEKYAFIAFATSFFLFNLVYWWWLFVSSDYLDWMVESDLNEESD